MDYLNGMTGSQVYEFPYGGNRAQSTPFVSPSLNMHQSNMNSSLESLTHQLPSSFTVQSTPSVNSSFDNNMLVCQVPDNIPLDVILRQLGVDVNALEPSFPLSNHYASAPMSLDLMLPSASSNHRRLVCHEVSDSDYDHHFHSEQNQHDQSAARARSMLSNVWERSRDATRNFPQSNLTSNMNSQAPPPRPNSSPPTPHMPSLMRSYFRSGSGSPPPMRNSPPPMQNSPPRAQNSYAPIRNPYPPMQNSPPPMAGPNAGAVNSVWNQASNVSDKKTGFFPSFFNKIIPRRDNANQSSPQQNRGSMPNYPPVITPPFGNNAPNSAVANVSNRNADSIMRGAPLPQQPFNPSGSPVNTIWNQMSRVPPQPPGSPMNNAWNQMSRSPPQQSGPPVNNAWNQMSRVPSQQSGPPVNRAWNQMSPGSNQQPNPSYAPSPMGGSPQGAYSSSLMNRPQQGAYPLSPMRGSPQGVYPPPPMNSPQQGAYPPSSMSGSPQGAYPPPPMGGPQQGSYPSGAPSSFASLLSRSKM